MRFLPTEVKKKLRNTRKNTPDLSSGVLFFCYQDI